MCITFGSVKTEAELYRNIHGINGIEPYGKGRAGNFFQFGVTQKSKRLTNRAGVGGEGGDPYF